MLYFIKEVFKAIRYKVKKSSNTEEFNREKEVVDNLKQELSVYHDFKKRLIETLSILDSGNTSKVEISLEKIDSNKIYIKKLLDDADFTMIYKIKLIDDYTISVEYNTID